MVGRSHRDNRFLTAIIFLVASTSVIGCSAGSALESSSDASSSVSTGEETSASVSATTQAPLELEPYTATIPGTTVSYDMLPVPGGTITIETEDGPEEVEIQPFYMRRTEITWDEYDIFAFGLADDSQVEDADAIMRPSRPYGSPDFGFGRRGYAALAMSYVGAMGYAEWLSMRTGESYRVPTEAEWEWACRAGSMDEQGEEELPEHAWFWDNAFDKTHPVASLESNEWGLHDMLGNAAEWCIGLDGEYYVCGGSWRDRAEEIHCGARQAQTPEWNMTDPQIPKSLWWLSDGNFVGFRIVRDP